MQLLDSVGLRGPVVNHGRIADLSPSEQLEDGYGGLGPRRWRRPKRPTCYFPPIPSEAGRQLMNSGHFGERPYYRDTLRGQSNSLSRMLLNRELGGSMQSPVRTNRLISQVRSCFEPLSTGSLSADLHLEHDTLQQSRHNHPSRLSMLLRSVLE